MKKNKMMRLASWLLVLTLLTTCIISGTFAKYVTSDDAEDTARVAKWGVTTTISGALFGEHYNAFSVDDKSGLEAATSNQIYTEYTGSVDSINQGIPTEGDGGNIVAPGTKSENMIINISGTPEVEGKVDVEVTGTEDSTEKANYSDIWLKGATYGVMSDVTSTVETRYDVVGLYTKNDDGTYTPADPEKYDPDDKDIKYYKLIDKVDVTKYATEEDEPRYFEGKYYPILWGYSRFNDNQENPDLGNGDEVATQYHTIADLKDVIENGDEENSTLNGATFKSLDSLSDKVGGMIINWEWPFEKLADDYENISSTVDGCDTILGKLMAWDVDSNYQVVRIDSTTTEDTTTTSYTGVTTNKTTEGVTYAKVGEENVACLTVGFNIKVTVSQVD